MPRVEGGLVISTSKGVGPRIGEAVPREEVLQTIRGAIESNIRGREESGLNRARQAVDYRELDKPTVI